MKSDDEAKRYPCAVCGDPWTLESPDYLGLTLRAPTGAIQWLGAHARCLNRVFEIEVVIGPDLH